MSLLDNPFAGHEQGDVASLTADGIFYRCLVYLNRADGRIDAICWAELPNGEQVEVFHNSVVEVSDADWTATAGFALDCPKIIASGTTFVVHWLQGDNNTGSGGTPYVNYDLYRATMDMEAFDASSLGWTAQGAAGVLETHALYDVCPVLGHDDFIVVRYNTATITVTRFDTATGTYDWVDTVWVDSIATSTGYCVLAVYAHETDNDVLVSYSDTTAASALMTTHLDADTGLNQATVETFPDYASGDGRAAPVWVQVGHCRVASNMVVVVAEAMAGDLIGASNPYPYMHHLVYRAVNSSTAAILGEERWCAHLAMCSRPFSYENGTTSAGGDGEVYVAVSSKSIYATSDWEQAAIWVVNLDYSLWAADNEHDALHPRPVTTFYTVGTPDARVSGRHPQSPAVANIVTGPGKRVNHISNVAGAPPYGPDVKTRTMAVGVWARQESTSGRTDTASPPTTETEIVPANLGQHCLRFYIEDPWTIYRDASDPTQPVDNFKGPYPRSMCQAIEVGKSLFISGGTPYLYDGRRLVESGWHFAPELIEYSPSNALGAGLGLTAATDYQYYCCFAQRDATGQVHRSRPSRVLTATTGASDDTMSIRVRLLGHSLRDSLGHYPKAPPVDIEVYRTAPAVSNTFYKVYGDNQGSTYSMENTPPNNDIGGAILGWYRDIEDAVSDDELIQHSEGPYQFEAGGAALVGVGAQVPQPTPAFTVCTTWQNRVWAADAFDPAVLWYSDLILPDYGAQGGFYQAPVFAGTQTFRIGEVGEVTAMQAMNNVLVVFTADGIYGLTAIDAGSGLLEVQAEVLHEGTGCIEPRSVVLGPSGVYFQSAKGFYLLDRGRQIQYLGAGDAIEDDLREAGNVRSAALKRDEHQIRLTCNGRPVTTYTTTWTINEGAGPSVLGTWEIDFGVGVPIEFEAGLADTEATVADGLAALIAARITTDEDLEDYIASVTSPGSTVVVVWQPDVVPSYTDTTSSGGTIVGVDTSELETRPWVLIHDYLFGLWSRAELVQTSATTRMAEAVGGCNWMAYSGSTAHVVATMGALLIEREEGSALEFTDETSTGTVGIPIDVETSWFHPAGIAGYQRIWSIGIQGSKPNDSEYSVDLAYVRDGDYDDPEVETDLAVTTVSPAYSRVRPSIQKCSAIRVRVYEDVGVTNSENISLTSIIFEVGVKQGPRRVAPTQVAT